MYSVYYRLYRYEGNYPIVNKNASAVEINGQKYDAVTGQLIGAVKKTAHRIKHSSSFISMDGIVRPPVISKLKPASARKHPKRAVHNVRRSTQRSKTLLRQIVKKPVHKKAATTSTKKQIFGRSRVREDRSALSRRHPKVKHFGILKARASQAAHQGEIVAKSSQTRALALSASLPSVAANTSHARLERLLDYALHRADAHKQAQKKSRRGPAKLLHVLPKWLNITLLALVIVGAGGFYLWQKYPQLSLKLEASKAHVENATLPQLSENYKITDVTAEQNKVVTEVETASGQPIIYTQEKASQPSESLMQSIPATAAKQTAQQNGIPTYGYTDPATGNNTAIRSNGELVCKATGREPVSNLLEIVNTNC